MIRSARPSREPHQFSHRIGQAITRFDRTDRPRSANLKTAANAINGAIILSGREWSFNATTGPRVAPTYQDAGVLQGGRRVDGPGGGVCQVSGTLYWASMQSGLDIIERHPHGVLVPYLPAGADATVSLWQDLRLRNPYAFPVRLMMRVEGDRLIAEVQATQPTASYRPIRREQPARLNGLRALRVTVWRESCFGERELMSDDTYLLPGR